MSNDILGIKEIVKVEIWRGDRGYYDRPPDETPEVIDLVTNVGRIFLAKSIGVIPSPVLSRFLHMSIGSGSTAAALTDTTLVYEVARKALSTASAQTNNVFTGVATFGGASDSITGVAIVEAALHNHASSGQGDMFQRVTFSAVTPQASDLIAITLQTNVGSNTI